MLMRTLKLLLLLVGAVAAGVLWQQDRLAVLALSRLDPLPCRTTRVSVLPSGSQIMLIVTMC